MALRNPSSKGVVAVNPNRALALLVSKHRRGWPSGWDGFQIIDPE
jgi:hypothetical protein